MLCVRVCVCRLVRTAWPAGRGARRGRTAWRKSATATVSPRSLCRGAASVWPGAASDEAAGQFTSIARLRVIGRASRRLRADPRALCSPCRVLLDRAFTDHDNIYHRLDPDILDPPPPPSPSATPPPPPPPPPPAPPTTTLCSPAADKFASTSETNTSDRSPLSRAPPSSTDLSQILLNIKSCRWRHFRPRTLPLHELDNAHPLFRKLSRSLKRPLSASAAGGQPQRPARVVPPHPPTAGKCVGKRLVLFPVSLLNSAAVICVQASQVLPAVLTSSTLSDIQPFINPSYIHHPS